jgi:apolipoprotein D and lipocalin family protein
VDLTRYVGTWYEVARYPNRFEDDSRLDCADVTATYTARPDGQVGVVNRCRNLLDGVQSAARGSAYAVEGSANSKLRVSFFWPFYGDYWVLGLAPDYSWAVVGDPRREYLWVLSRTAVLPAEAFEAAMASARAEGFDPARLKWTVQAAR